MEKKLKIYNIRNTEVIVDSDLAKIFGIDVVLEEIS